MAGSSDTWNNVEIEKTKPGNSSPNLRESALSPVLTGGLNSRKFLIGRRLTRKKGTRVKLTDRFKESNKEECVVVDPIKVPLPVSFDESLSASQTETLIDHLDKLEELDNNRKRLHKLLLQCNKIPHETFDKLEFPTCDKNIKPEDGVSERKNIETEYNCQRSVPNEIIPSSSKNVSTGFQTAKGNNISVSETDIKRHSKLFDDIIHPSQSYSEGRHNKHAFLRKLGSAKESDAKNNTDSNSQDANLNTYGCSKRNESSKSKNAENILKKSNLDIKVTENVITQGKNFFGEEFSDIKFNNENLCGFKKASIANANNTKANGKVTKDIGFSLTQAIYDSGISNTQIVNAFDDVLLSMEANDQDGFRGFSDCDVKESRTKYRNMEKIVDHDPSFSKFSKKRERSMDNTHLNQISYPPRKKQHCLDTKDNFTASENFEGFASASGRQICVLEKYVKCAAALFNDVDLNLHEEKLANNVRNDAFSNNNKDLVNTVSVSHMGFQKASGKSIIVSKNSLSKAQNLFEELSEEIGNSNLKKKCIESSKVQNSSIINQNPFAPCGNFINQNCTVGFSKASGKKLNISKSALNKAKNIFDQLDMDISKEKPNDKSAISEFKTARVNPNTLKEKCVEYIENESDNYEEKYLKTNQNNPLVSSNNLVKRDTTVGFSKASGKKLNISESALNKAKNIFDQLDMNISKEKPNDKSAISEFKTARVNPNTLKEKCVEYIENERDNYEEKYSKTKNNPLVSSNNLVERDTTVGFCKASGKKLKICESNINQAKHIFDDLNLDYLHESNDNTLVGRSTSSPISSMKCTTSKTFSVSEGTLVAETTPVSLREPPGFNLSAKSSKRKLGVSRFRPIQICDNKLDKAKLLFDEDFSGISPIKPKQTATYTSTPIKQNNVTSVKYNGTIPKNSFSNFVDAAGITPIKKNVENVQAETSFLVNSKILCTSPVKADFLGDLETERRKVECRLRVLLEREKLGREAFHRIQVGKSDDERKPRKGLLYKNKTGSNRTSLVSFVKNGRFGENATIKFPINQQNAENLHFSEQTVASLKTEDGAVIIPNSKDMVGLSEIKNAFEAMPGVEPRLIPKGWIKNHFKWIVWKLASYESMFPNFEGCVSLENIIQQLKYRYDREIDRAERPAVRKICEKDDASQKRMILFVSDIKMLETKKYELELCDGWYAVRTIIDEPLCHQIIKGKIKIGTKLQVSGAELLNCDGCHPLEATNLVCLKINCNCTRRAVWHAKLGFQQNPNPFPIQLHSVYPLGGTIGAIKICIVRVYPLKYMEKLEGRSVWRNRKAEEIAAQKWENEANKKMEQIEDEVRKKLESCTKPVTECQALDSDISNIKCPKKLYDILERSKDPECLQQNLSASQQNSILTYQSHMTMKKQQEIAAEVSAGVSKIKLNKRDVVAVMKLLVLDALGDSEKPFNFSIWRPTEAHLQSLKEGRSFTIQNVLPRPNGELNSTAKTAFKQESASNGRYFKYKRRLVSLEELVRSKSTPDFNEFDSVGIVVQTKMDSHRQEVWITDNVGRLLLISVYDGPDKCALTDNLKRGQPTTVCNLTYRGLKKDIIQASANHFTVFSSYSQHKHLQEGLEAFKKEMVKDVQNLLEDCDNKIEVFRIISDINSFSGNFDVSDDDTVTTGTSRRS